jgi:hypothetical protein
METSDLELESHRAPFRSGRALAWVASCGVSLSVLASVALSAIEAKVLLYPDLLDQIGHEDTGVVVLSLVLVWAVIALFFATLFGTVSFLVWFYRAADNARVIGQRRLLTTPWTAVLWWFVPLANLVRPYRAVKAVYWASETRSTNLTGDLVARSPGIFPLWWGTWLVSAWLQNISARLSLADGLGAGAMWAGIVALPFTFVSALCIIAVIWSIESRQEHLALFGRAEWPSDEDQDQDHEDDDAPSSR